MNWDITWRTRRSMLTIICSSKWIRIVWPSCNQVRFLLHTVSWTRAAIYQNLKIITLGVEVNRSMSHSLCRKLHRLLALLLEIQRCHISSPWQLCSHNIRQQAKLINRHTKLKVELSMKMSKSWESLCRRMRPLANFSRKSKLSKKKWTLGARKRSQSFLRSWGS